MDHPRTFRIRLDIVVAAARKACECVELTATTSVVEASHQVQHEDFDWGHKWGPQQQVIA